MSDGNTDAARQTKEALEYVRRKTEREMTPARKPQHTFRCTDCKDINFTCTITTEDGGSRPIWCPYSIIEGKTPWKKVRSLHISPPAPEPMRHKDCDNCHVYLQKKEAAKAAREQVLDELIDELPNVERSFGGEQIDTYIETHELKELVESLRQPEPQQ